MGFLDKIFSKENQQLAAKVLGATKDVIADNLVNNLKENWENATGTSSSSMQDRSSAATSCHHEEIEKVTLSIDAYAYEDLLKSHPVAEERLKKVFEIDFPSYEVRKAISPVEIGGTGNFMDYSYGLYLNGVPKLFIMLVSSNTCSSRTYRWSKEAAEKAGIPLINVVIAYENKIDYTINRLKQYL